MAQRLANYSDQTGAGACFVINLTDSTFTFEIRLDLIENLGFGTIEALKCVPRRGLEIGGILLGRFDAARSAFLIEDYEPIDSEHRSGPSYLLSEADRILFSQALARLRDRPSHEPRPVGFYRSQTRDGIAFNQQDNAIAREMFDGEPSVCMLVKPAFLEPSVAQLGMRAEDVLQPLATFPFDVSALREGDFTIIDAPTAGSDVEGDTEEKVEPAAAGVPVQETPRETEPQTGWEPGVNRAGPLRKRPKPIQVGAVLALTAASLLLGGVLIAHRSRVPARSARPEPVPALIQPVVDIPVIAKEPPFPDAGVLLAIERQDGSAILTWNREAPAVRDAVNALLVIEDGWNRTNLHLGKSELEAGRVVYIPRSREINVEMQLFASDHFTAVRSLGGLPESPAPEPESPVVPPLRPATPSPREEAKVSPVETAKPAPAPAPAPAIVPPPAATVSAPPTPTPTPVVVSNGSQASGAAPVVKAETMPTHPEEPALVTRVSVEPINSTGIKTVLGELSPVHILRSHFGTDKTTPPRALRKTLPDFPPPLVSDIHGERHIDIRVTVDSDGSVSKAERMDGLQQDDALVPAVLNAARQWTFEPAQTSGRATGSKVLLHFVLTRP